MSDFINTVDTVGDVALADSIITKNITEFRDNVVTKLGRGAFYQCDSLTNVDLPAVTRVGYLALGDCDALVDVNLPLATEIASNAFDKCLALTRIVLPSATTLGSQAFRMCDVLSTVELGSNTIVGEYAFYSAPVLKVLALRSTAGMSTLLFTDALKGTPIESGTGYIYVPGTLLNSYKTATNWSTYANQFRKLEEWTVDGTVTGELDVGNRCMVRFFNEDGTLLGYKIVAKGSDVAYDGDDPVKDGEYAFVGWNPSPDNVTADMDCYAKFKSTAIQSRKMLEKTISGSVEHDEAANVGNYSFYNCTSITSINFPAATKIGNYAFEGCSKLASVNLPVATNIGTNSFYGCTSLTTVDLPVAKNFTSKAFGNCSKLVTVILRSTSCSGISYTDVFSNTPIASGSGYIYVPSSLVSTYQTTNGWKTYSGKFRAIEDYPDICGGA